jgi:hypothetical protein
LLTGLTEALAFGSASGTRGDIDISSIEVSNLQQLLEQARLLKHQTVPVRDLIEAAEVVYSLRCAMKNNDSSGVIAALEQLSSKKSIPDIILEEVAVARAEVENCLTISALYEALSSFDDSNPKSLELSLVGTQQLVISSNVARNQGAVTEKPSGGASTGWKQNPVARRRYSYENINSSDIDPDTISISELDAALDVAKLHGVLTDQARRLFRTTQLIRSLRCAMKLSDWPRVQEIITESNFAKGVGDIYDHVAVREIQVITTQLEMRKSIVDLAEALKHGWANCSNGIVDISTLSVVELNLAIDRAEKSMSELGHPPSAIPQSMEFTQYEKLSASINRDRERQTERTTYFASSASSSFNGKRRPSVDNSNKSITQTQVELLLSSARIVAEVREYLSQRELEAAGVLADEGVRSGILHSSVITELKLYSIEINRALGMMKLCQALREGMAQGDLDVLEPLILEARRASMQLSNDLGLVRTLEKAQLVYKSFLACRKALVKLSNNYRANDVQHTIDNAVAINISGYLIQNARTRLSRLRDYEAAVEVLRRATGGALADEQSFRAVIDLGNQYGMKHHPWTHHSEISLKLSNAALRTSLIAEAVGRNKPYVAATETMRLKRNFLLQPHTRALYSLELFPRLRKPADFFFRVSNMSRVIPPSTVTHTDEEISTSVSLLNHALAALSVWIFSHCIQGLEKQLYSRPEVLLRNLIIIGRNCATIRDEILLQIVKQIRGNPNELGQGRLWNMLCTCLYHFPPSQSFENYLELYLILESEEFTNPSAKSDPVLPRSPLAKSCIRHLHESVFKYGYSAQIISKCDLSLKTISNWLLFASPIDGFVHSINAVSAGSVATLTVAPLQLIRGTKSNWIERFNLFIGSERISSATQRERTGSVGVTASSIKTEDGSSKSRMTQAIFVDAVSSFQSTANVDRMDRDLIQFLVYGRLPEQKSKIAREYFAELSSFSFLNAVERALSAERRAWLRRVLAQVTVPTSAPSKITERKYLAGEFWEKYIERMSSEFDGTPSSKEAGGNVIKKVTTVTKSSFTTITWEVYRELVLSAMEMYLESAHNRIQQELAAVSSHSFKGASSVPRHTSDSRRTNRSSSGIHTSSAFEGFEMFTVDPESGEVVPLVREEDGDAVTEDNIFEHGF